MNRIKPTPRRALAWALVLMMTLTLLPTMAIPALAASSNASATATLTLVTGTAVGAQGDDLYWDGAGNLTLNNFTYITTAAIALEVPDGTTIVLTGKNTITTNYDGADSAKALNAPGTLTIQGTGALAVTADNANGTGLFCREKVTISGGIITANGGFSGIYLDASTYVSGGIVVADGGSFGIWADMGTLFVTDTGIVVAKGSSHAIHLGDGTGNPANADVLGINAGDDAYDVATIFSDSEGERRLIAAEDRAAVTHAIIIAQGTAAPTPLSLAADMEIPDAPAPVEPSPAPADPDPAPANPDPAPVDPTPAPAKPDPAPGGGTDSGNPKTGDTAPIFQIALALLLSGTLAVVVVRKSRTHSN